MTHHRWYVRRNNKVAGPFPQAQLQEYLSRGQLVRSDEISHDREAWVSIEQSGYFPHESNAPQLTPQTHHRWYVRKHGKVAGPFPHAQIDEYLVLGRLLRSDEISLDRETWVSIQDSGYFPEGPSMVQAVEPGEENAWEVERARARHRWLDERLYATPEAEAERRRAEPEPEPLQALRHDHQVTKEMILAERRQGPKVWLGLLTIVAIAAAAGGIWYGQGEGMVLVKSQLGPPDCNASGPGVNWTGCVKTAVNLQGARLRHSHMDGSKLDEANLRVADLSFSTLTRASLRAANLEGAALRAADFTGADLTGANLGATDLTYATFTGAKVDGVRLEGARLDKAAWVDGRICAEGSVGACR
ncbi:MAG: pentapeptide repeat-containing protein [Hydrogenophilaceae bacterium]|nr:pentapeptide repeat-containing protein [Hydrogenophilaceae bacterium]